MRRATLSLTLLALLVASASRVDAGGLDLRLGAYFPRGNDTLFQDVRSLYLVEKSDFYGVYGGIEYNHVLMNNVELGISLDGSSRTVDSSYRDYTWDDGTEIRQSLKLNMVPLGVSLRFVPTSKRARIAPFVGGGVDAIFYKYEEFGDFVCFPPAAGTCRFDYDVVPDAFVADGTAFGFHVLGGLRVYINRDIAIVGEGRYQWAKDDMGDDFAPNEPGLVNTIDLSGATFTVGVHIRF
jgi:opacity protein-like surface antigen